MTGEIDVDARLAHLKAVTGVLSEATERAHLPSSTVGAMTDNGNVLVFELAEMVLALRGEIDLDELVMRWHAGSWPDKSLEDVVRIRMGWDHPTFANWITSGHAA